jgi:RHS repeat-associated protein
MGRLVLDGRDATGTLYRRNRYYDPASGRFTQEDPIGVAGGVNLYGYAGGDPINNSDPFGLCPAALTGRPCGQPLAVRNAIRESTTNARIGEFGQVRNGGTTNHQGNDILALRGQSVKAVDIGTVSAIGHSDSYGYYVELAHRNADGKIVSYSFYAHLDQASPLAAGDRVFAGQLVGVAGNTGNALRTPTHLHFEIRTQSMPGKGLVGRRDPQPDIRLDNRP